MASWNLPMMKAVLVSTGVVSMALMLKLTLPVMAEFLTFEIPLLWSFALSWMQLPYLYLLINCIILSIVASSKLQPRAAGGEEPPLAKFPGDEPVVTVKGAVVEERESTVVDDVVAPVEVVFGYVDDEEVPVVVAEAEERESGGAGGGEEVVVSKSKWTPPKTPVSSAEKPPYSARFGHRKTVKSSPEGKAMLRVSRPKRQEALESTWRTITDGRAMPLTRRHLRKSDTFGGGASENSSSSPVRAMKKSDTFSSGGGSGNSSPASAGSGGKMRRESSLSQDELNRRVEAFIKKFNDEMRMQRQESLNQYKEMVSR